MIYTRTLVVAFLCVFGAAAVPLPSAGAQERFEAWARLHNKVYESEDLRAERMGVFFDNEAKVESMTKDSLGGEGVKFALNQFADMTGAEFASRILMRKQQAPAHDEGRFLAPIARDTAAPDSFDWRDKGAVTPIKDQGSVGTCWCFSTVGNIEGQWFLSKGKLVSLSEEQLVDCDGEKDPAHMMADCSVFGGWPYLAYQSIIGAGGIESEQKYPYCAGNGGCYPCPVKGWNATLCGPPVEYCNATLYPCRQEKSLDAAQISDWAAVSSDETEIQARLVEQGPLSVLLDATMLQFYHSGVWDTRFCNSKGDDLDHAVLLIGYGTDKPVLGKEKDFWLVKNSWGTKWGEKGYFRIRRGVGKCGINAAVTTSIV